MEESSSSFDVAYRAMVEEQEKTRRENEQLVEEELEKMKVRLAERLRKIKCCVGAATASFHRGRNVV